MMYKFKTSRDQQQGTHFTLCAHNSLVTVKAARLQASHSIQSQSRLALQFSIHENHDQSASWTALEHSLKERLDDIIASDLLPSCILRTHVFILHSGEQIESVVLNAVWACFLLHGVPMKRSIFQYQWKRDEEKGLCVLDLNETSKIIYSQANNVVPQEAAETASIFKRELTAFLSYEWSK